MEFVPFVVLTVILKKLIDLARVLIPTELHTKTLIPVSMAVGIALALLFWASPLLAGGIEIWNGVTLADADVVLVVVYGLAVGSGAGVLHDLVKPTTPPHDTRGA